MKDKELKGAIPYYYRLLTNELPGEEAKHNQFSNFLLALALIIGTFLLTYPSLADYWNRFHQSHAIMEYADQVANMSVDEYANLIHAAEEYNARLAEARPRWDLTEEQMKEYEKQLAFNSSGNMGYINIPKIDIQLPIYHGVSYSWCKGP